MTTAAGAGSSARSRASESTSSDSPHEGRSRINAASLPMVGHRAARLDVSRDQNCAGSSSVSSQDSQATCTSVVVAHSASRLVLPKPEGATRSTSGSPADSSLRSRAVALHPGPRGPGHSNHLAPDGPAVVGLHDVAPRAPCSPTPAGTRRQFHPAAGDPWVMPVRHPQPIVGVDAMQARGDVKIRTRVYEVKIRGIAGLTPLWRGRG